MRVLSSAQKTKFFFIAAFPFSVTKQSFENKYDSFTDVGQTKYDN